MCQCAIVLMIGYLRRGGANGLLLIVKIKFPSTINIDTGTEH